MADRYTAKIYMGDNETTESTGNNADDLYTWMLTQAQGKFGDIHGELIDNNTRAVIKRFRKSAPDC